MRSALIAIPCLQMMPPPPPPHPSYGDYKEDYNIESRLAIDRLLAIHIAARNFRNRGACGMLSWQQWRHLVCTEKGSTIYCSSVGQERNNCLVTGHTYVVSGDV